MTFPTLDPTGQTDNWAALVVIAASGMISLPPGWYKCSGEIPLPAGCVVTGAGSGQTVFLPSTPGMTLFSRSATSGTLSDLLFADFTINADGVAGVTGISTVLCDLVKIRDVTFAGCDINASIDRGREPNVRGCRSIGTPHNIAGQLKLWSSVDNDYIFNPTVEDYKTLATVVGATWGIKSPVVLVRRGVSASLSDIHAEHLQFPAGAAVTHIQFEGDCQGGKIDKAISNGAQYGIVLKNGSGSGTPSYMDITNCDVDQFTGAGIWVDGDFWVTILGGGLYAPQGVAVPCIKANNLSGSTISHVKMVQYQATAGIGIDMTGGGFVRVTGNTFRGLSKAMNLTGAPIGLDVQANSALSCTAGIVGSAGSGSVLTPNRGM